MHTTLDHLEKYVDYQKHSLKNPSNRWKEFKIVWVIFGVVSVFMILFTNAQLFFWVNEEISDHSIVTDWETHAKPSDNSISTVITYSNEQKKEIAKMIEEEKQSDLVTNPMDTNIESVLQNSIKDYPFEFNTLPPTNRVIVPKMDLDVPLVVTPNMDMSDFSKGNFDKELTEWIVKYPTTPAPGQDGNTLLFGHTSQEVWLNNPYGTVFSKLPDLQPGDEVKLVREWQLYKYRVIETVIKTPKQVNKEYMRYQDMEWDFLTLMGCYPLGTTYKRMMVMAKRID